jgi:HSP20 family molecular chaperone IbpA
MIQQKVTFDMDKFLTKLDADAKKINGLLQPFVMPNPFERKEKQNDLITDLFKNTRFEEKEVSKEFNVVTLADRTVHYVNMAGYTKENISISVEDFTLKIIGEKGGLQGESTTEFTFTLPKDKDLEKTSVELENGVLRVSIGRKTKTVVNLNFK